MPNPTPRQTHICRGTFCMEDKLLTREEASKELLKRNYKQGDYPGMWVDPKGQSWSWFQAVNREKLKFDGKDKPWRKLWGFNGKQL